MGFILNIYLDCDTELTVTEATDDRPIQRIEQCCEKCDLEATMSLCWYPDGHYVGITTALPGHTCTECDENAVVRYQRVGYPSEASCPEHTSAHYRRLCREIGLQVVDREAYEAKSESEPKAV